MGARDRSQRASSVLGDLILGDHRLSQHALWGGVGVGGGRWDHLGDPVLAPQQRRGSASFINLEAFAAFGQRSARRRLALATCRNGEPQRHRNLLLEQAISNGVLAHPLLLESRARALIPEKNGWSGEDRGVRRCRSHAGRVKCPWHARDSCLEEHAASGVGVRYGMEYPKRKHHVEERDMWD